MDRADTVTQPALAERLGLLDSTTIVMGSMIGSGVFIVSADIARQVQSPALLMATWALTAVLTMTAALSYGELAAMMPRAGGQYVYLREAFGPLWGFLYGWTLFAVIQTGTLAAVAVAFAKFLGVFVPAVSADAWLVRAGPAGINTQMLVAIALILALTWHNTRGIEAGARVQNIFTIAKVGALAGLIAAGVAWGRQPEAMARNFGRFWEVPWSAWDALRLTAVAMVGALFSSDAWNNVTFTAGEIRNPRRNLPLSLALGVGIVSVIYLACNLVYLMALPLEQIQQAPEDRVATAVISKILGPAATQVMALAVMVSTFGCLNGMIFAGARVYYAMARDGLFFGAAARVNEKTRTPNHSLWMQGAWAAFLTLTGRYSDLLDYVIFAVLLFYMLTIAGLFVLRRTRPGAERPYRAFGYPLLPAAYIGAAAFIELMLLLYKPSYTWPGLLIVLTGIPVYLAWRKRRDSTSRSEA
ncbi:MAG: amino acid permease [Bryobacteraceae bacterium]|nr:amino acid permease [Bryobacteraceae bacterium]MCX7603643.1 amino acid permease [Bryobacteraceae bacterium]